MPSPSIRWPPDRSRWCGGRRRCATGPRPSAASSTPSTTAFRLRSRSTASLWRPAVASARWMRDATVRRSSRPAQAISWFMPTPSRARPTTIASRTVDRPIPASRARAIRWAAPMSSRMASSASPIPRSPAPTSFRASRPPRARTTSCSTRANWRAGVNGASISSGSRPSASGSAPRTTSTTRRTPFRFRPLARHSCKSSTRRAWRCSISL